MEIEKSLTKEHFKLWITTAVQRFLVIRKKPVTSSFDTLALPTVV